MMGLGSMAAGVGGIGNSSSSSSNLSALAPPFTVERSNPKLNSIPILHFSDSSYATASDSQTWQYPHSSAPVPEVNFNSTVIDSLAFTYSSPGPISPPRNNWSGLSPNAKTSADVFSYAGEVKPYYSHYVSPIVGKDSTSGVDHGPFYDLRSTTGPDLSPQVDYVQSLSGLEYTPRWDEAWAFDEGKQTNGAKGVEHSGSFSYTNANVGDSFASKSYISAGVNGIEYGNNGIEDFGLSYGKLNLASARESGIGSSTVGRMDEKLFLEQNLSFLPHASSRMPTLLSRSAYPESYSLDLSLEGSLNLSDYQKLNSPDEKRLQPLESSFSGSMSVTRSSPAVVIRPPPANNGLLSQKPSRKTCDVDSMSGTKKADFGDSNGAKQNDTLLRPIDGSSDKGQFTYPKKGSDSIFFATPLVKELSSQVPSEETLEEKMKAQCGSHLPDLNVSSGSSSAVNGVRVSVSTENSSECVDNYAPSVDSPCWKGAPVSHFSPFDDVELGKSPSTKKKSKECYDFDHEAHPLFFSLNDSRRASSQKPFEGKKRDENQFAGNIMPHSSEIGRDANSPTIAQSLTDAVKAGFDMSSMNSSKGVTISNPLEKHISNDKHSCAEMNDIPYMELSAANCTVTFNDASEGGAVAFHAAEDVLCSPSSPKDASEHAKVEPNPSLDVQAMVNAIRALSEVLVTNCTNDSFALEDNDCFVLKHVIRNLEACLDKKKIHRPLNEGPTISGKLVGAHNMATMVDKPQVMNEALNSHAQLDNQQLNGEKRGDVFPGKQAESSSLLSPLRGDEGISAADNMTQAIKKVLDENFMYDKQMDSQALLFKNLWLEAEAKLCSIGYKARFDRMKTEMEKFKSVKEEGNSAVVEKMLKFQSSSNRSTDAYQPPKRQDSAIPKPVMERFHILKSRDDSKNSENAEEGKEEKTQETVNNDVEASIMDRFRILKSRNENSKLREEEDQKQPNTDEPKGQTEGEILNATPYFPQRSGGHESVKEFHLSVANDPVVHSLTNDILRNQFSSGCYDNSSDWEHVMKDDFAWKN